MLRGRDQNEVTLQDRRMDSLARILDNNGSCVAVSILGEKFVIASNAIAQGQGGNQPSEIIDIFNFFKKTAEKTAVVADFNDAFRLSCSKARFGKVNTVLPNITDELCTIVIEQILRGDYSAVNQDLNKIYGSTYPFVLAELLKVHQDFLKLKASIEKEELTKEQMSAFSLNPVILRPEVPKKYDDPTRVVHAEVKILEHVVKEVRGGRLVKSKKGDAELYFGISKLCCLGCRTMIEAANGVFQEEKRAIGAEIFIKTRGRHDLDFDGWTCPMTFNSGYYNRSDKSREVKLKRAKSTGEPSDDPESIEYKIGKKSKEMFEKAEIQPKPRGISQTATKSDSESEDASREISDWSKKLGEKLAFLEKMKAYNVERAIEAIHLSLELYNSESFQAWYEGMPSGGGIGDMTQKFAQILSAMNQARNAQNKSDISAEEFIEILKNEELVSRKVFSAFTQFTLQQQSEKTVVRTGRDDRAASDFAATSQWRSTQTQHLSTQASLSGANAQRRIALNKEKEKEDDSEKEEDKDSSKRLGSGSANS
jgi:hypothetical protein